MEQAVVSVRLIAVLMAALGLLGAVDRASACALDAPVEDCCPSGAQQPCDGMPSDLGRAVENAVCCAAVPIPSSSVSADSARVRLALEDDAGSHVPGPPPASALGDGSTIAATSVRFVLPSSFQANASLTYLRTARLRL